MERPATGEGSSPSIGLSAGGVAGSSGFRSGFESGLAAATSFLAASSFLALPASGPASAVALGVWAAAVSFFDGDGDAAEAVVVFAGLSAATALFAGEAARFSFN